MLKGVKCRIERICIQKVVTSPTGEGLVIEVKGNVASIMFDSVGLKKLAKDIAPIKKL